MKNLIWLVLFLNACTTIQEGKDAKEKIWVYIEVDNSTEPHETEYDYFYGQIDQGILDDIRKGKSETLFELRNARYIDVESDSIMIYEDEFYDGTLFYKIKDVKHIDVFKIDPLVWQSSNID